MANRWRSKYALVLIPLGALLLWGALFAPYLLQETRGPKRLVQNEFPNFLATDWAGRSGDFHDHLAPGRRYVVALWATWCEPCLREMPQIQKQRDLYRQKGIEFLLINYDGGLPDKTIPEVKAWMISQRLELESFFDFKEVLFSKLNVVGLPYALGVDENRRILWNHMGEIDWMDLRWLEKTAKGN